MEHLKVCSFILCILNFIIFKSLARTGCEKSKCQGPIRYYEELKCIPMWATTDSCCPYQYNCDHLKERLHNKCYIRDSVYNIGDVLASYDTTPCDSECICTKEESYKAGFHCNVVDCPTYELKPGCYLHRSMMQCCAEVVCDIYEKESLCMIDGEFFMKGDEFIPNSHPNTICQCQPDKNSQLLCRENSRLCNNELRFPYNESCTPVYYLNESPQFDCNFIYRCYNQDDWVIKNYSADDTESKSNVVCKFGDLTLKYGDQLGSGKKYETCMNCTCEVGPMLTCRRFSDEVCKMYDLSQIS